MTSAVVENLGASAAAEPTPHRIFLPLVARQRFEYVANLRRRLGRPPLAVRTAFSVKTNPRRELLVMAREHEFLVETISPEEIAWAKACGYGAQETIYNGPVPLDPHGRALPLAYVFADSVEAFARNAATAVTRVHGVRLRPAMIVSRFGVSLEDEEKLYEAVDGLTKGASIAVSFHARREDYKGAGWRDVAGDVLERAVRLQLQSGRSIVAFDVGGGWTPEEFDADFGRDMRWLADRIIDELPRCSDLIAEPGQAICTPTEALMSTVLEVRRRRRSCEAIVDVGYPDWPEMHSYAHGMFVWRDGVWTQLGPGGDRLGGRTCLEYDVIDGLRFPADLQPGDRLLLADAGSYDHAMAFDFARGGASRAALH
jgi:diaminopimelate decarboxylase